MAQWTMDLNKYVKKTKTQISEVRTAYAYALYSSIVRKTPVGTPPDDPVGGRARANWQIQPGRPATGTLDKTRKTPMPISSMPKVEGDESIFISNNLDYIEKLEYGGYPKNPKGGNGKTINGYSKQAPEGMVGVTLANNENIFNAAVRAVKGKGK